MGGGKRIGGQVGAIAVTWSLPALSLHTGFGSGLGSYYFEGFSSRLPDVRFRVFQCGGQRSQPWPWFAAAPTFRRQAVLMIAMMKAKPLPGFRGAGTKRP
jgi:hypothetical protein